MSADVTELFTTRPFAWGVLIIGDTESRDIPSLPAGATVASTDSTVAVGVRHAQDVDDLDESKFQVEVRCVAGDGAADGIDISITVPSGRMAVGDADHVDVVRLDPGRGRLHIEVEPADLPERVAVWLSPDSA